MGEIADMMLDGTLDAETGEYIGDANRELYGMESPGFPVTYGDSEAGQNPRRQREPCPHCGKRVKAIGLTDHIRDVHGGDDDG